MIGTKTTTLQFLLNTILLKSCLLKVWCTLRGVPRVEAGYNTSTAALLSHKRRQKGNPVPGGYNWATLFLGDINTGTWPSRLGGGSQMRQQNMAVSSAGLRPKSDCSGKAQKQFTVNYRCVLSWRRALQNNKLETVWRKFQGEKLVTGPRWAPDTKTSSQTTSKLITT
jgi:hypothetical protein